MRTLKIAMFAALISFSACKKKDEKAAEPAKTTEPAKAGEPTPAAAPAAPAAAGNSDTEAKGLALMDKMGDMFAADAKDCEKLATDIKSFITDNKSTFDEMKAMESKQTPEQKKDFETRNKGKMEDMMKKMEPAMTACGSNANVQAAMKQMPE